MRHCFVSKEYPRILTWTAPFVSCFCMLSPAQAQVTPAAGGAGTQVSIDNNVFNISGGAQTGGNLFHEFDSFSINNAQSANFLSDSSVFNIVGQVSGLQPSYINGLVQVSGSDANLYLVNPAGILFGKNSQISLNGSFSATTADQLGFGGNWLDVLASNGDYSAFSGDLSELGFSVDVPSSVVNRGDLAVEPGESLLLVGNNVVNEGRLVAPGGEIGLVAVGRDTVRLGLPGSLLSLEMAGSAFPASSAFTPTSLPALVTGDVSGGATRLVKNLDGTYAFQGMRKVTIEPEEVVVIGEITTRTESADGGTVALLGRSIDVLSATVDASGRTGGKVRIGRSLGGENLPGTDVSLFEGGATVRADGLEGAGGEIAIGSNLLAYLIDGSLSAVGKTQGGLIDSSAKYLWMDAVGVDASGGLENGEWLVDSAEVALVDRATGLNQVSSRSIENSLNSGTNVTVKTSTGLFSPGDISLLSSIIQTGASTGSLTLTGRRFDTNGSTIDLASTGGLTFNLNAVNPESVTSGNSLESAIAAIGNVAGDRQINLGEGTYNFSNAVDIDTDVQIAGAARDNTVLNIDTADRLFRVAPNSDVAVKDVTFGVTAGVTAGLQGGGIVNLGTLALDNIRAVGNLAIDGGAVENVANGRLSVTNSLFERNQALNRGGAIYSNGNLLNISNSTLEDNTANISGGAVFAYNSAVAMADSVVRNNTAVNDYGGAIAATDSAIDITSSTLSGNQARIGGGIAATGNSDLTIADTVIVDNIASGGGGGVAALQNSRVSVSGDLVVDADGQAILGTTRIERNSAQSQDGGGILIRNQAQLELSGVLLRDNSASDDGGGVAITEASTATVTNSNFENNLSGDNGGGLYRNNNGAPVVGETLTVENSRFLGNRAVSGGGLFVGVGAGEATVNNSVFRENQAFQQGGGLRLLEGRALVESTDFTNNRSAYGGGIDLSGGAVATLRSSELVGNEAAIQGGGIRVDSTSALNVESSTLANNQAGEEGGGLFNSGTVEAVNATIHANVALLNGGAIASLSPGSTTTLRNNTISENRSVGTGGVAGDTTADIHLLNTIVAGNRGAIFNDVSGRFVDEGSNLIGQSNGSTGFTKSTLVGRVGSSIDPLLEPLADNGGPTRTQLLRENSAAINAGTSNNLPNTDQRGLARAVGGSVDIGAVELASDELPVVLPPSEPPSPVPPPSDLPPSDLPPSDLPPSDLPPSELTKPNPSSDLLQGENFLDPTLTADKGANDANWTAIVKEDNSDSDNRTISQLERAFGRSFEDYWDLPLEVFPNFDDTQDILRRAQEEYKVNSAVIYAVFLPEKSSSKTGERAVYIEPAPAPDDLLNLALVMPEGELVRYQLPVTREQATQQVNLLRTIISDPEDTVGYQPIAQQLYQWLLAPLEDDLAQQGIHNLMYALDAGLRNAPIIAMRDYNGFSLERYGISLVPNMGLMQANFDPAVKRPTVAMGISQFDAAPPLPAVPFELAVLDNVVSASSTRLNEGTTINALESVQALEKPGVLHLATHASFDYYSPESSSISMWNESLSMKEFAQLDWLESDLEMLILSACSTAVSSVNAELGFVGLAAAAGVDATVGSLWEVSDIGTLALMSEFYAQLEKTDLRFEALRQAQLSLLEGKTRIEKGNLVTQQGVIDLPDDWNLPDSAMLDHPFFWSAFTMVGNPW